MNAGQTWWNTKLRVLYLRFSAKFSHLFYKLLPNRLIRTNMSGGISNSFFEKPTIWVAKNLVGKTLVRKYRGKLIKGIITETEAYRGLEDKASHASRGRTKRTEVMFGESGTIYIYLIYGMYWCLNIVTEKKDYPAAVLIRGAFNETGHFDGPGKLSRHFHIDKSLNGKPLSRKTGLWIGRGIKTKNIKTGKRVGVDYAGRWAKKPWRFYVKI